ncbi:MAG TPA: hypothetical protein VHW00_00835 [Thermoanaerobaculia bacterium]|nr:hypothetical protein [Thermoanaerobaculia bacterium]
MWFLIAAWLFGITSQFTPGSRAIAFFGLTMMVNDRPVWEHAWLPLVLLLASFA